MGTLPCSSSVSQVETTLPPSMSLMNQARSTGTKAAVSRRTDSCPAGTVWGPKLRNGRPSSSSQPVKRLPSGASGVAGCVSTSPSPTI